MKRLTMLRAALAVAVAVSASAAQAVNRDPVVALDDRRPERPRQRARQELQRQPEGLQGRARCSRARTPSRWPRRSPRSAPAIAPHILQVFEVGHGDHDGAGKARSSRSRSDGAGGREVRPQGLHPAVAGYYTTTQGPDAVVPVQQLDAGVLLQQGRVQEGGPRSRTARPKTWPAVMAAAAKIKASGDAVRLHDGLAVVGAIRERSAHGTTCRSRTKQNGFAGIDTMLEINKPLHIKHWRTSRSGTRRATSPTPAARTRRRPSSTAASAR